MDMTSPFPHPAPAPLRRSVAVMQPYFFPHAGYFRLLEQADCFVILDCVQFNRRGRVHRCQLPGTPEHPNWLTLPLRHQPRDVRIRDLAFAAEARAELDRRLKRMRWMHGPTGVAGQRIRQHLHAPLGDVVDFLDGGLRLVADLLELRSPVVRSSTLDIPAGLRGQQRIIEIVHRMKGTDYLNSPGGVRLYDPRAFDAAGLRLSFLPPYHGRFPYLLPALMQHAPQEIRDDLVMPARTRAVSASSTETVLSA